jgi:hypothetical protein
MRLRIAVVLWLVTASACATVSDECQRRIDACLARCEAVDPDRGPALSATVVESQTECQKHCGCGGKSSAPPPKAGTPTFTGTAPR